MLYQTELDEQKCLKQGSNLRVTMTEDLESPPLDHSGIQALFYYVLLVSKNEKKELLQGHIFVPPVGLEPTTSGS